MKSKNGSIIITCTMFMPGACSKGGNGDNTIPGSDTSTPITTSPVETNQANTNYRPAFTGQTRVNGVHTTTPASGTSNYGSRIMFDATGNLLVTFGDRFLDNVRVEAQSVSSTIGKVIRITTDGAAAPGNPTFSQAGAIPGLYTMGHRNPQGLAIHPVTGDIWQSEHGPRGGDEINRLLPGANYGWPVISYGIEYSGQPVEAGIQQQSGMEQPVYYWDPVVSPSGITFYAGNRVPEWENNLFLCSLTQTHLIRLVIENNRVTGEE